MRRSRQHRGATVNSDVLMRYCAQALAHYGIEAQLQKTIEECRELREAIGDWIANPSGENQTALISEIADVSIMLSQLTLALGLEAVSAEMGRKIARQRDREGWAK